MTTASLNYTGRKRILRKSFDVSHLPNDERLNLAIWIDPSIIASVTESDSLVLDLVARADHERFDLKLLESQEIESSKFEEDSKLRIRLAIVDRKGDSPGKIKNSSEEFRLTKPTDDPDASITTKPTTEIRPVTETFFDLKESNKLGSLLWRVDTSIEGETQFLINSRLLAIYGDSKHHPLLRGHVLPAMVREMFRGVFMNIKSLSELQGSDDSKWFRWGEFMLQEPVPSIDFWDEEGVSGEWLEWLDRLIEEFSARKFVNGKETLLQAMENYSND